MSRRIPAPPSPRRGRRLLVTAAAAALTAGLLAAPGAPASGHPSSAHVDPAVYADLSGGGTAEFLVYLTDTADLSRAATITDRGHRLEYVYEQLTSVAETSQADLRADLDARGIEYRPYWVVNALLVTGDAELLAELARRPDVARIEPNREWELLDAALSPDQAINAVEWNVTMIGAPRVWDQFGRAGDGIVVASIDTGVQFDHPALRKQYRGYTGTGYNHNYNWFDPAGICGTPAPCDNNGHGTHVTGTMVGDDGAGNQIGVAPRARWIAAKGCEYSSCSSASLLAAGQWMLAPTDLSGANPQPRLAPHVVNNSWGGGGGSTWYQPVINAWVAAGIFPVFAAGNSGYLGCGSASSPGDNPPAYAVGAYDRQGVIAPFSGRGPSAVDGSTKPNVSAPGVNIRSSVPTNSYAMYSGTSMAAPHVAGTVALIWSVSPPTVRDIPLTRKLIDATATDVSDLTCGGVPGNNNVYGEGRLNAYAAVVAAP
ncbi:MAG TPA: S8 family serine peptidase [Natronosporangium sp.]|nr:S8 family serine peptidase [Natronosporangium sp.]